MTHTRMCQECPVSLEKLSFFFIQVKIIQVLVFDNWHPLNERKIKCDTPSFSAIPTFPLVKDRKQRECCFSFSLTDDIILPVLHGGVFLSL